MTSFSIQSFGCRVNQAEAFLWADELQRNGLEYEEDSHRGDLVLINTCTLTSRADRDVRSFIRRVSRENPAARLVVTGCFAERALEELEGLPQVWKIFSNKEKESLPHKVLPHARAGKTAFLHPFRSRALVKIQDGCRFSCTFCIIPRVRGKSVSLAQEEVLNRINTLIKQGFEEIVLTGIHLCLYGQDLKPPYSLLELLCELEKTPPSVRFRLSSLDPRFMDRALLEHLVSSQRICPHFHLSLQSGSDRVLFLMGRKIKVIEYKEVIDFLNTERAEASVGADIIVGFPGETEKEFNKTHRFLEESPLTYFHVFSYSPRPGTPASQWTQVNAKEKRERAALLRRLSKAKNLAFRRQFKNVERKAIVIKKQDKQARVLTDNYIEVFVPECFAAEADSIRVKIKEARPQMTLGTMADLSSSG